MLCHECHYHAPYGQTRIDKRKIFKATYLTSDLISKCKRYLRIKGTRDTLLLLQIYLWMLESNGIQASNQWRGKKLEKDVFCLITSEEQRKNSESPWGIEPQTFGFCASMLYHWATETLWWARPITKFIYDTVPEVHSHQWQNEQCWQWMC